MVTDILLNVLALLAVLTIAAWAVARWHLHGADMSAFDNPVGERFSRSELPSDEARAVVASLGGISQLLKDTPMREHTAVLRKYMDEIFADPDPSRAERAMRAMLEMKKLDIAALRRAADGVGVG